MEIGQQKRACRRIVGGDHGALVLDVLAQLADYRLQWPAFRGQACFAQHACLDRAARGESIAHLVDRRLDDVPALARVHLDEAAGLQLHQGLAHQGSTHREQVGEFLLAQSRPPA